MTEPDRRVWPKGLVLLADVVENAFANKGCGEGESRELAETAVEALAFYAGGRSFYLPKGAALKVALKHRQIYKDFTGDNVSELAQRHCLTVQQVYAVIKQQREVHRGDDHATPHR
ncbi:hypothetical protein KZO25_11075 [Halomonas sp. ANAO-440]|uniref:Mor transcription activator family protein n=1 Tax=Halomonas sp. ANAO-440 TaxID=2861360 RepID=UPI001CAA7F89|nr:Mor transcription activator family protein [Halomonas sp. ANAO-440]MBZ0330856.1 hypothetical protein [Halomonas sp. ANAO-440]